MMQVLSFYLKRVKYYFKIKIFSKKFIPELVKFLIIQFKQVVLSAKLENVFKFRFDNSNMISNNVSIL